MQTHSPSRDHASRRARLPRPRAPSETPTGFLGACEQLVGAAGLPTLPPRTQAARAVDGWQPIDPCRGSWRADDSEGKHSARLLSGNCAQQVRDECVDVRVRQLPSPTGHVQWRRGPLASFLPAGFPFRITSAIEWYWARTTLNWSRRSSRIVSGGSACTAPNPDVTATGLWLGPAR